MHEEKREAQNPLLKEHINCFDIICEAIIAYEAEITIGSRTIKKEKVSSSPIGGRQAGVGHRCEHCEHFFTEFSKPSRLKNCGRKLESVCREIGLCIEVEKDRRTIVPSGR